jgi:hypothetical protein
MKKLMYILFFLFVAANVAAQENYVIDSVCIGAERVYRGDGELNSTGGEDAVPGGDEIRGVAMPEADAIAGLHAVFADQPAGDGANGMRQLFIRHLCVAPEDGGFGGVFSGLGQEHTMQAGYFDGHERH